MPRSSSLMDAVIRFVQLCKARLQDRGQNGSNSLGFWLGELHGVQSSPIHAAVSFTSLCLFLVSPSVPLPLFFPRLLQLFNSPTKCRMTDTANYVASERTTERMNERIKEETKEGSFGQTDGRWTDGRTDRRTDGRKEGTNGGRNERRIDGTKERP